MGFPIFIASGYDAEKHSNNVGKNIISALSYNEGQVFISTFPINKIRSLYFSLSCISLQDNVTTNRKLRGILYSSI